MSTEGKWIQFRRLERPAIRRTDSWDVLTAGPNPSTLGHVKWFGRWRCYAFWPFPSCVFEKKCLRDIAEFCEVETVAYRNVGAHT